MWASAFHAFPKWFWACIGSLWTKVIWKPFSSHGIICTIYYYEWKAKQRDDEIFYFSCWSDSIRKCPKPFWNWINPRHWFIIQRHFCRHFRQSIAFVLKNFGQNYQHICFAIIESISVLECRYSMSIDVLFTSMVIIVESSACAKIMQDTNRSLQQYWFDFPNR